MVRKDSESVRARNYCASWLSPMHMGASCVASVSRKKLALHWAPKSEAVLLQGHMWGVSALAGILELGSRMLEGKSWMRSSMY